MGEDGLACSKWPQGSHFPQCSNSIGSLVAICPLWAKVSETHCGHHGLEEIWQIQKTDPARFSPLRREYVAHWYCMSLAVKHTSGVFAGLSKSLVKFQKLAYVIIKLWDPKETINVISNLLSAVLNSRLKSFKSSLHVMLNRLKMWHFNSIT